MQLSRLTLHKAASTSVVDEEIIEMAVMTKEAARTKEALRRLVRLNEVERSSEGHSWQKVGLPVLIGYYLNGNGEIKLSTCLEYLQ